MPSAADTRLWSALKLLPPVVAALVAALPSLLAAPSLPAGFPQHDPWQRVLASVGWGAPSRLGPPFAVLREADEADIPRWRRFVEDGGYLILEGASPVAAHFGFRPTSETLRVASVEDLRSPELRIVWEIPEQLPLFSLPQAARLFARERFRHAPLLAGLRLGRGALLWCATSPGIRGYEKFPYLPQALADLGAQPPFASRRLWAFFDSSYRLRVDPEYFASRWRRAGIAALHIAAWHYHEPHAERDAWLRALIEACHRHGILVYAWLELPHVSEQFWDDHPQWREKTAILQDAHLDWRKLMNLQNRDCFAAIARGIEALLARFDWDGVNLAELYFESLESYLNPSRFTPMNDDVRREFAARHGFDPIEIFNPQSPLHYHKTIDGIRPFLEFRALLAQRMQEEWIAEIERIRRARPHLDLVLTHVDDRFDTQMRDAIGADAARLLPLLDKIDFQFLIEDPATIWNLGPERYPELARRYAPLTPHTEKLAIDINIVERYQDVYPTKQQTGAEFFQLVHLSSLAFRRVALYFESSILKPDLPLLPAAIAIVREAFRQDGRIIIESPYGVGLHWQGPALVDGKPWPVRSDDTLWLPAGRYEILPSPDSAHERLRILDFNGDLRSARAHPAGLEFEYESSSRAIALLSRAPLKILIDGAEQTLRTLPASSHCSLLLPRGAHRVTLLAP